MLMFLSHLGIFQNNEVVQMAVREWLQMQEGDL